MQKNNTAVTKYLSLYAEQETAQLPTINHCYHHALVIPVFDETVSFWQALKTAPALNSQKNILIILVINLPANSKQNHNNQQLANVILADTTLLAKSAQQSLLKLKEHLHILLIDRFSDGHKIPTKQGVGLARKIGADIALKLIQQRQVLSPWIHTTDADAQLPALYFTASEQETETGALLYPFAHTHQNNSSVLYELSLFYYVAGLNWAGSPYGFHTLGSTIACHYQAYAQVRGYPKRAAGEDFYLLNKIAKVGKVRTLASPAIKIQARPSHRVPFGTGPAIRKIENLPDPINEYLFYHPKVFTYLKTWLQTINILWQFNTQAIDQALEAAVCLAINKNQTFSSHGQDSIEPSLLIHCLKSLAIEGQIQHGFDQCKTETHFLRHMHHSFDGFQTLKFIHYLRNYRFSSIPLTQLLNNPDLEALNWTQSKAFTFSSN